MKSVLILPDGFGIRNFILNGGLKQLSDTFDVRIYHTAPEHLTSVYDKDVQSPVEWMPLYKVSETPISFFQRKTLHYAHMYWARTTSMQHQLRRKRSGSWKSRFALWLAKITGACFAFPGGLRLLDVLYAYSFRRTDAYRQYLREFRETSPNVVFCSNQWNPQVAPAVLAAKDLHIPTATFIFSWDNLTSKGRVIAPFDHYFVWSQLMKDELLRFYPDVQESQVAIVGTPQFDSYADSSLRLPREEFFEMIGADPDHPLISYAGGHGSTHPDEEKYLETLAEVVRSGKIDGHPQIIFRPTPTDNIARFQDVLDRYPEIILSKPLWCCDNDVERRSHAPLSEDTILLYNLIYHSDVNVNIASTMTIDAAIFDIPVINPAFDLSDPLPHGKPIWDFYYQFDHYRPVVEFQAAQCPRTVDAFVEAINQYLDNPALDHDGRMRLVNYEVELEIGTGIDSFLKALHKITCDHIPLLQSDR